MIYYLLALFLGFVATAHIQMNDKFYFLNKQWIAIDSFRYETIIMHSENDMLYSIFAEPDISSIVTIIFFHDNAGNASKWIEYFHPLIKNRFQVCLDYLGYSQSRGTPTHLPIRLRSI